MRKGYELCRVLQNKLEYCSGSNLQTGCFSSAVFTAVVAAVFVF